MTWMPFITGLLGVAITLLLIPTILRWGPKLTLDRGCDFHHTNKKPVPRVGGLALAAAFVAIEVLLWAWQRPERNVTSTDRWLIVGSALAMFAVGFWDDLRALGAKRKLLAQALISCCIWYGGIGIETFTIPFGGPIIQLHGWGGVLTVLWLVGMTNLVNLIDGVDGLAGGICLMLMALTAYVGRITGDLAWVATGMAGALLGFLRYNFPPARIYLGDGGAYFLGFLIGLFALINSQKGTIAAALIAPLFVLALPIVDTALAILRRGLRGLPIFRPDKRHIHHRLLGSGMSRRRVVISIYMLTAVFLVLGLVAFWSNGKLLPALLGLAVMILLFCAGKLNFSREWFAVGRVVGNSLEMRKEIRYALTLTRWLAMEGGRCETVEELWDDLVLAGRKLGFTSIKLTLGLEQRCWTHPSKMIPEPNQTFVQSLHYGDRGTLELHAPGDPTKEPSQTYAFYPNITDSNLFEILSELLAEGWSEAALEWLNSARGPLLFTVREEPSLAVRSFGSLSPGLGAGAEKGLGLKT